MLTFLQETVGLAALLRGELGPWQLPRQYGMRIDPSSGLSGSTSSSQSHLVCLK